MKRDSGRATDSRASSIANESRRESAKSLLSITNEERTRKREDSKKSSKVWREREKNCDCGGGVSWWTKKRKKKHVESSSWNSTPNLSFETTSQTISVVFFSLRSSFIFFFFYFPSQSSCIAILFRSFNSVRAKEEARRLSLSRGLGASSRIDAISALRGAWSGFEIVREISFARRFFLGRPSRAFLFRTNPPSPLNRLKNDELPRARFGSAREKIKKYAELEARGLPGARSDSIPWKPLEQGDCAWDQPHSLDRNLRETEKKGFFLPRFCSQSLYTFSLSLSLYLGRSPVRSSQVPAKSAAREGIYDIPMSLATGVGRNMNGSEAAGFERISGPRNTSNRPFRLPLPQKSPSCADLPWILAKDP